MTDNTLKARLERCKALQEPEQVVEAKEGYVVQCRGDYGLTDATLSEALTLRTAEDVRREALAEAADKAAEYVGGEIAARGIRSLIDNPAPDHEPVKCDDSDFSPASSDNDVIYMGKRTYIATDTDVNALQAEAWDEGYIASADDGCSWTAQTPNPYRKGDE